MSPYYSSQTLTERAYAFLKLLCVRACRFTELDVEDPYMETRGQGYEQFFLAAYAHAQVGGIVL